MRTTIRLPDDVLTAAKERAAATGRTLTALIEDAVRAELARTAGGRDADRFHVRPAGGRGLQPGVDLDDNRALLDVMEAP